MSSEDTKLLEFNQYHKSNKTPFIIYADLESLIKKLDVCKNNSEKSSTTKAGEHILSGFSKITISSFKSIEPKHDVYRGKYCMKKFCEFSREHAMDINNFKKKQMKLLTNEQQESYENAKICCNFKETLKMNMLIMKNIIKLEIIVIIQVNREALQIIYRT